MAYKSKLVLLDEARGLKQQLQSLRPFTGQGLKIIQDYYRIRTNYSSNSLEGFTYSLSETENLLKYGITIRNKPLYQALAVTGLDDAYNAMFGMVHNPTITFKDICHLHSFLEGSLANNAIPGRIRDYNVGASSPNIGIGVIHSFKMLYAPVEELTLRINKLWEWHNSDTDDKDSIEKTALFHKRFELIHPFGDGNGRVGRLAMNLMLIQNGYLPVSIGREDRAKYIECLQAPDEAIVTYILEKENNSLNEFFDHINALKETQRAALIP